MTLAATLAEFICGAAVPDDATAGARIAIADCVGCTVGGAGTDTVQCLVNAIEKHSGPASLLGLGRSASVREAALVNGTAAHALDYDDINWTLYGHPSVVVAPPLIAIAEAEGLSTADLLDAYVIGVEVAAKLGRFANPRLYLHGWHATSALGVLGANAGAARIKGLSRKQTEYSLGIAASLASGVRRNFGSMVKPLHAGKAAEAAVFAAQLAASGFTADDTALEGRFGYFDVLVGGKAPDASEVGALLGDPWDVSQPGIVLKRYPSCGATHCALDALLELREELNFYGSDVEKITCGADPLALKVLLHSNPTTGLEGKFSMEFCLAVAAIDGAPGLRHFSERWTSQPAVKELISRIVVVDRPDLAGPTNDGVPASVEIRLKDGRQAERTTVTPRGDPRRPLSQDERKTKFLDCTGSVFGDRAIVYWRSLESLDGSVDLRALFAGLRGTDPSGRESLGTAAAG